MFIALHVNIGQIGKNANRTQYRRTDTSRFGVLLGTYAFAPRQDKTMEALANNTVMVLCYFVSNPRLSVQSVH